jgi:hypothetical protein
VTFLLFFLPMRNYHNRKGKILSSQGKNRTKLACFFKFYDFFLYQNHFLAQKIAHCLAHFKKRKENVFAYSSKTDRDILKIPTDLDSEGPNHFSCVQNPLVALLEIIQNFHC